MNAADNGTEFADGTTHESIGCREVLEAARAHPHYRSDLAGPYTGRGVAIGHWGNWGARSSCRLDILADGSITFTTGSVDVTGTRTSLAMLIAQVLEVPTVCPKCGVEIIKAREEITENSILKPGDRSISTQAGRSVQKWLQKKVRKKDKEGGS